MRDTLGDIICTSSECTDGKTSVDAMDAYFQSLDASAKATYQTRHDSIMDQFNAAYSWYSPFIPFNPGCCTVIQIGRAADGLLCQMQGGQNCVPLSSGDGSMSLSGMIVLGAVAFLTITYFINRRI